MERTNKNGSPITQGVRLKTGLLLFWEKLWPALLRPFGIAGLFLLLGLFDFWPLLSGVQHALLLTCFIVGFVYFLVQDVKDLSWPEEDSILNRLEQENNLAHAPLHQLTDAPFSDATHASPLWQAAQKRALSQIPSLKIGKASFKDVEARDPLSLRYGLILALILGASLAWGDFTPRLKRSFSVDFEGSSQLIVDMWIDPPSYTGKAPLTLALSKSLEELEIVSPEVPEGSTLHVRLSNSLGKDLKRVKVNLREDDKSRRIPIELDGMSGLATIDLTQQGALTIKHKGKSKTWPITILEDRSPIIVSRTPPTATEQNEVRFEVEISDDYGIEKAYASFRLAPDQERPLDAPNFAEEILQETDEIIISGIIGKTGGRTASLDLTSHPWAGLEVLMRIVVEDGAGQKAETLSHAINLPERPFYNPLAQSIIHERRNLAVAPASWPKTQRVLDALTFAPDRFFDTPTDYVLLRAAYWDLVNERGNTLDNIVADFWPLALQLEDQSLELARQRLQEAQDALREALERGASQDEIEALVQELRLAMQNYIAALAQSGQATADNDKPSEEVESSDLNDMLEDIEKMSEQGANNAARQLLSELAEMLENLTISQSGQGGEGQSQSGQSSQNGSGNGQQGQSGNQTGGANGQGEGGSAQEAADLISKQRELADETFEALRNQYGLDGTGLGSRPLNDLKNDQEEIANSLEQAIKSLDKPSLGEEARNIEDLLEQALENMQDAADALGAENPNAAGTLQEEALSALREGASKMVLSQEETDNTQGSQQVGSPNQTGNAEEDPLGRSVTPSSGEGVGIPELSDPERVRALVEELRRRLSEPNLSRQETEYLERLLQRF